MNHENYPPPQKKRNVDQTYFIGCVRKVYDVIRDNEQSTCHMMRMLI